MPDPSSTLLRICVIATPVGDEADLALDALLATVAATLPHEATRAWRGAEGPAPSFAELHRCDVALICARRMPLHGEALARVQWYCQRGRPLVVLGAGGSPTFARWSHFDFDVLGIAAEGMAGTGSGGAVVRPAVTPHPVLADIGSFRSSSSVPHGIRLTDDVTVVLETGGAGSSQPLAWTRDRGSARLFATALGQPDDLATPAFAQLVSSALRWVTCREVRE